MAEYQACGCCEIPVRQGCTCMHDTPRVNVLTHADDPLADENAGQVIYSPSNPKPLVG
jgi:hypothetical protein